MRSAVFRRLGMQRKDNGAEQGDKRRQTVVPVVPSAQNAASAAVIAVFTLAIFPAMLAQRAQGACFGKRRANGRRLQDARQKNPMKLRREAEDEANDKKRAE